MERLVLAREGLSVVSAHLALLDTALASDYDLDNVSLLLPSLVFFITHTNISVSLILSRMSQIII